MAIYRLFKDVTFSPEDISVMAAAYECARQRLGLVSRTDARAEEVARKVIEIASNDGDDAEVLCGQVVAALSRS